MYYFRLHYNTKFQSNYHKAKPNVYPQNKTSTRLIKSDHQTNAVNGGEKRIPLGAHAVMALQHNPLKWERPRGATIARVARTNRCIARASMRFAISHTCSEQWNIYGFSVRVWECTNRSYATKIKLWFLSGWYLVCKCAIGCAYHVTNARHVWCSRSDTNPPGFVIFL